jgi:ketosteroid isomerase-like protein
MKRTVLICSTAALMCGMPAFAQPKPDAATEILALERQAMDGWLKGDPDPVLAITSPEITYFHIMTEKRTDGLPALKALFETYRGTPLFDSYEIVDPKIQTSGDMAVLTYLLVRHNAAASSRWNATQVYQRGEGGWRIIHTHYSQTRPQAAQPQSRR